MKKRTLITGLEISSSKISVVVFELGEEYAPAVVAYENHPSKGIARGAIADLNEAVHSVSKALNSTGARISQRPENIHVNISGQSIKVERSKGMVPLSARGREVTRADMARCVNVASTIQLPYDREVIHKIVHSFSVDDQPSIKNPLGLYASRLSCEMYMITAGVNHIQTIYKCVNNAGYDVKEVIFSGIADAASLLSSQEREEGAVILNMGASSTEASFFHGGTLNDLDIIPAGAQDFRGEIKSNAEFNTVIARIKARAEEFIKKEGAITTIVLTGGLSFSEGVVEALEEKLPYPVKMGIVRDIRGNISSLDSVRGITAIGLAKYACEQYKARMLEDKNIAKRISDKVVEIFNNYF